MRAVYYVRYEEVPMEDTAKLLPREYLLKRETRFLDKKEAEDFVGFLYERQQPFPYISLLKVTEEVLEEYEL